MPTPYENETEKDFMRRCIPIVIKDGTAKNGEQAFAICRSIYERSKKKENALIEDALRRADKWK